MNISRFSRIALLSAIFAAPVFADQAPEAPKVEAPKVEVSTPEAPKVETPKVEAPKVEAPKVEAPKADAPKPGDAPATEESTFAKAKNIVSWPFVMLLATAPDAVANFTKLNAGLNYVTDCSMFSKDGFFKTHAANGNFGRGIVLVATTAALIIAYNKFVANNADVDADNDSDFFEMNDTTDADQQ